MFIQNEEKLILETEPYTDIIPHGGSPAAIELNYSPESSFCFTVRTDFAYKGARDQCGVILYQGDKLRCLVGSEYHDGETIRLNSIVFHHYGGDRAGQEVGQAIKWMYYRVWYRAGAIHLQYSYNGDRFTDMRSFLIDPDKDRTIRIGVYACSPGNSSFDCTFSEMMIDE